MLVYANSFALAAGGGPGAVIDQISKWVGQPRKFFVDPLRVAAGVHELRLPDGATFRSRATVDDNGHPRFPYFFYAQLGHSQPGVPGRRWITEVGLRQNSTLDPLQCSILLRTDEVSAKVVSPIQPTRPRIVQQIAEHCSPISDTPGLQVIRLTAENAPGLVYEIERHGREHPIVMMSCDREGRYPIAPERMQSVLVGLAKVIHIPVEADNFDVRTIVGRQYWAYGGAINIVLPIRKTPERTFCPTVLLRAEEMAEVVEAGATIESDVLATITHRTNLPHSWKHTSGEDVAQAVLSWRLQEAMRKAGASEELTAYEELLQEAATRLEVKDRAIESLRAEYEASQAEFDQVQAENEALKHALSGVQSRSDSESEMASKVLEPMREAVRQALAGTPTLEQALRLAAALYPTRLAVLATAFDSARDSDAAGFRHGEKALSLLLSIAEQYWSILKKGGSDQQARATFGKDGYAAKEASLSGDGRRRRTFRYFDRDIFMEKHLKYGVKDSAAETLRIHFEWIAEEEKIVIGHCGKHLDF